MKQMFRNLSVLGVLLVVGAAVGCSDGASERATETPPGPSEEQMRDYMEESMNRGGMDVEIPDPASKDGEKKDGETSEETKADEESN